MSETRICEFVFPSDTNHLGTLYGGTLLAWMDKAAAVAALRRAGATAVVTAAVDALEFRVPIHHGELVEPRPGRVGGPHEHEGPGGGPPRGPAERRTRLCTAGTFTLVAIDADGRPTPVR